MRAIALLALAACDPATASEPAAPLRPAVENVNAAGDGEFRSDDARMRNSAPRVSEFAVVVVVPQNP